MTEKIPPVLNEEVFEDLVWHLLDEWITAKYAKDEVTKTICGLFRAGIQQAKEEIFEWGNEPCPHQFYANTKQQCRACWDELRNKVFGKG